jgi:hypothetical protein
MFFARVEHYDFSENDYLENDDKYSSKKCKERCETFENKECLICLEKKHERKEPNLLSLLIEKKENIVKECECECFVHDACLEIWLSKNMSCIICRNTYNIQNFEAETFVEIQVTTYNIRYFSNKLIKAYLIIKKILFVLLFFFTFFQALYFVEELFK